MAENKKYLDYIGLKYYDEKIKNYIKHNGSDITDKLIELIGGEQKENDESTILERIMALEAAVGDVSELGDEVANLVKAIVGESLRAKEAEKTLAEDVASLEATHAKKEDGSFKSVEEEVNEAVTALIDGAPSALDTLKEIADWIANQDENGVTDAVTLLARVEDNTSKIALEALRAQEEEEKLQEQIDAFIRVGETEIDALFEEEVIGQDTPV